MDNSNCRFTAIYQSVTGFRLEVFGFLFFLLAFSITSSPVFSQQQPARKVRPFASAKIDLAEIERRERAGELRPQRKKVENENLFNVPHGLPIPRDAKGETFKVTLPENTGSTQLRKMNSQSGLQPNFPAIGDNGLVIPPDMGGAVGPNHLMTALNSQVQIQDKTGTVVWGPTSLNNFFLPLVGSANVFDPKVLYDPFAGRWMVIAPANSGSASSALLIAVSPTSDPTPTGGLWTGFAFDVDGSNATWFDYPSIGFNNNWIVATGNMFTMGGSFTGSQVYIFDKAALYSLTPSTALVNLPPAQGFTICPAVTLDNSMSTEYLVMDYNGNSGGNGYVRIHTITGTSSAPVYTITALFPNVNQTWMYCPSPPVCSSDFAPQAGSTHQIQNNDSRMQNAVYQAGSLWFAQTAFLPAAVPTHSAAQWWQINPTTAAVQQFGRVSDSSAVNFYAFPTIAVNAYGDALLGYSSFSATQFASANYSFRLHSDPSNTMQSTVQFRPGSSSYFKTFSGSKNRWGDYSSTVTDPNNFSMCTLQEYAASPLNTWGTEWNCLVPPVASLYMEDRPGDLGAEPNPSTLPMWESADIWLRQNADPTHSFAHITENAEYRIGTSNPNYVYVDVRNRGAAASAGTELLTLYWAKASSGLSWPDPWNGGIYFDPPFNTMLMGQVIGTVTLPIIGQGQEYIQDFQWNPPNPAVYTGALAPDQNHFCLLARITTSATVPGMTFPEIPGDLYGNVQRNNRIAWKNISLYDLLPGIQGPGHAVIANLSKQNMNVKLRFTAVDADGNPALLTRGVLKLTARGPLAEVFRQNRLGGGGARSAPLAGDGARSAPDGTYQIVKDGGFLQGIALKPRDYGVLEIVFIPNNRAEKMKGYAVTITQIEQVGGAERIVGGQTLVFGNVKGFGTSSKPKGN